VLYCVLLPPDKRLCDGSIETGQNRGMWEEDTRSNQKDEKRHGKGQQTGSNNNVERD